MSVRSSGPLSCETRRRCASRNDHRRDERNDSEPGVDEQHLRMLPDELFHMYRSGGFSETVALEIIVHLLSADMIDDLFHIL